MSLHLHCQMERSPIFHGQHAAVRNATQWAVPPVAACSATVTDLTSAVCFCLQCGLARFPNNPTVLLVYANYIIHVKKEPRAARQQLQLAGKGEASIFDKYAIFAGNVSATAPCFLWRA